MSNIKKPKIWLANTFMACGTLIIMGIQLSNYNLTKSGYSLGAFLKEFLLDTKSYFSIFAILMLSTIIAIIFKSYYNFKYNKHIVLSFVGIAIFLLTYLICTYDTDLYSNFNKDILYYLNLATYALSIVYSFIIVGITKKIIKFKEEKSPT